MANEGLRAAIDRITHETLPLAGNNDLAVVDRARMQVKIAEGVLALVGEGALAGYVEAFYATASIAGIGTAQPISPREVWETQLRPKLEAAFAARFDDEAA